MEYRKLGNSGCAVSTLCLGTMTFGAEADEATSHRLIDDFVAAGGNFIDTADVYSAGASEDDHRPLARRAPGRGAADGDRDQGPLPDGPGAERPRHSRAAT